MPRPVEEPTVRTERDGTVLTHPSFGQVVVSQVSGRRSLYGSDFEHNGFVSISVHESELRRDLSHDWPHARKEIVQFSMSHAQWAAFVSSFGDGSGTQVTLDHREGRIIPQAPLRDSGQLYKAEADERLGKVVAELEALKVDIAAEMSAVPVKKRASLMVRIDHALMEIKSGLPFVADSFAKHCEKRVEKAKTEVYAWMQSTIHRDGLDALLGKEERPLELEAPALSDEDQTNASR